MGASDFPAYPFFVRLCAARHAKQEAASRDNKGALMVAA